MKHLIVIAAACTMLVGCNGRTDKGQDVDSLVENEQVKTIPDSMLIMTDKKFDGYTLVELKANPLSNLHNGFGGIFHMKDGNASEFFALFVGSFPGASRISKIDIIVDGELDSFVISKSGKLKDGRILAQAFPYQSASTLLAKATSAEVRITYDTGQKELTLGQKDLKYFRDIFNAYESKQNLGEIKSVESLMHNNK